MWAITVNESSKVEFRCTRSAFSLQSVSNCDFHRASISNGKLSSWRRNTEFWFRSSLLEVSNRAKSTLDVITCVATSWWSSCNFVREASSLWIVSFSSLLDCRRDSSLSIICCSFATNASCCLPYCLSFLVLIGIEQASCTKRRSSSYQ